MKVAIFIHGFNVKDQGVNTIQKIIPFFEKEGYKCTLLDYGWLFLLGARLINPYLAKMLKNEIKAIKDISNEPVEFTVVGHSNGCTIINKAAHNGADIKKIVYINPALDNSTPLSDNIERCHVWHSPSDAPLWIAKWLPFHAWGDMGRVGYKGKDKRYTNFNKEDSSKYKITSKEHSDIFHDDKISYFGPIIAKKISEQICKKTLY